MEAVGVAIGVEDMVLVSGEYIQGKIHVKECIREKRQSKEPVLDSFHLAKQTDCDRKILGITLESEVKTALVMLPDMTEEERESWVTEEGNRYIDWLEQEFYIEHMSRKDYRFDHSAPMAVYLVALPKSVVYDAAKSMRMLGNNTRIIDYWEAGYFDLFRDRKDFAIVCLYADKASVKFWDEHLVVWQEELAATPEAVANLLETWDERVKMVNGRGLLGVKCFWHSSRTMAEDMYLADWLAIEDHFQTPELVPLVWEPQGGEELLERDMTLMHAVGTLVRLLSKGKALWADGGRNELA